jgi:hypothetical protein
MENRYLRILPGESYIGIHTLADLFLCALKYPTPPCHGIASINISKEMSFEKGPTDK